MQDDDFARAHSFKLAVIMVKKGWAYIYHEEMPVAGSSSEAQFKSCMVELRKKVKSPEDNKLWADYLDLPTIEGKKPDISTAIATTFAAGEGITSIDDVTPNQFKSAVYAIASSKARQGQIVQLAMPVFLRAVLREVFAKHGFKGRLNVGANRHFPRMFRWLQEVAEDTAWPGGQGLKIRNAGGRGPVAANPFDPKTLVLLLDHKNLR